MIEKNEKQQRDHANMLSVADDILKKHGITPILTGGALLGIVRDGDLIPWAMGATLFVNSADAIKKTSHILQDLKDNKYKIAKVFIKVENWKIRFASEEINIEIVGYYKKYKNCYERIANKRRKVIPAEFIDGELSKITFRGHTYSVPYDVEKYLTHLYGNWRNPIKSLNAGDYRSKEHCEKI